MKETPEPKPPSKLTRPLQEAAELLTEALLEAYLDKHRRVRMAEMREQRRSPLTNQPSTPEESKDP